MELAGYPPDPWQRSFLESDARRRVLLTGRQVGKSLVIGGLGLHLSLTIPHHLTVVAAQREKSALELIEGKLLPLYDALYDAIGPARMPAVRISSPTAIKTVRFSNGSRIEAVAMTPTGVRSFSQPGLVVVDEAAYVADGLFAALSPMLARSRNGILVIASSAGELVGFFYRTCQRAEQGEADGEGSIWQLWKVRSDECEHIPPEHLAAEREDMPAWQYEREYECQFSPAVAAAGMVYPWFDAVSCIGDPPEAFAWIDGAADWGFRKPGALMVIGQAHDGVIWILDEVYEAERDIDYWVEQAWRLQGEYGVQFWRCDPEDPGNIAKFRARPLPATEAKNPVAIGLRAVNALGKSGRLKVARHCRHTISQFHRYMLKRNQDGTYRDEDPDPKCEDHLMDTLRYGVMGRYAPKHVPIEPRAKRPKGW